MAVKQVAPHLVTLNCTGCDVCAVSPLLVTQKTVDVYGVPLGVVTDKELIQNINPFLFCKNKPLKRCTPEFIGGWMLPADKSIKADGKEILVNNSYLVCKYGGQVTIDLPDPPKDADAPNVFDKLKEKLGEKTNGLLTSIKAKLEVAKDAIDGALGDLTKPIENLMDSDGWKDMVEGLKDYKDEKKRELREQYDSLKEGSFGEPWEKNEMTQSEEDLFEDYVKPGINSSTQEFLDFITNFEEGNADALTGAAVSNAGLSNAEAEAEKSKNDKPNKEGSKTNKPPNNQSNNIQGGAINKGAGKSEIGKKADNLEAKYKKFRKDLKKAEKILDSAGDYNAFMNGLKAAFLDYIKDKYGDEAKKIAEITKKVKDAFKKLNKNLSLASNVYNGIKFLASGLPVGLVVLSGSKSKGAGGGGAGGGTGGGGAGGGGDGNDDDDKLLKAYWGEIDSNNKQNV